MKFSHSILVLLACSYSCGEKVGDVATSNYGTLTLSEVVDGNESVEIKLDKKHSCEKDVDTGLLTIGLSNTSNTNKAKSTTPQVSLKVKNFSSTASTYSCLQTANNTSSATDLGDKYQTCAIEISTPSLVDEKVFNKYAMHRASTDIKPFTYSGSCVVEVSEGSPTIKAKVNCTKLVQVALDGSARNPIDASVTATLTGSIECTLK